MSTKQKTIHIVGGGLAGSECALQLAHRGYQVELYEMRNKEMTPAHKTNKFAELVCSNSFGSMDEGTAPGHMKWEAEQLNSYILKLGKEAHVPAGSALGVDRELFSQMVTEQIQNNPNITIHNKVIESIDDVPRPTVIATGPLTHNSLAKSMMDHFGDEFLYFFDAIAPIIDTDSINMDIAWKQSRWDKGTADYLNCPLNEEEYFHLINEIKKARKVEAKDFEKDIPYFESCLPIEVMVERGDLTLSYGPLKPIGLSNPKSDKRPYAVVQLRQDNKEGTAYNMVGFQTKMAYPEQQRIFRMIPGLEEAEFLKLGSIHRNLYINSTKRLNKNLSSKKDPELFFAGQITGCEGYFESTCMGLLVSNFIDDMLQGKEANIPPRESALGSLLHALTGEEKKEFQPTNINFGLFPIYETPKKIPKKLKREKILERAKNTFSSWLEQK